MLSPNFRCRNETNTDIEISAKAHWNKKSERSEKILLGIKKSVELLCNIAHHIRQRMLVNFL